MNFWEKNGTVPSVLKGRRTPGSDEHDRLPQIMHKLSSGGTHHCPLSVLQAGCPLTFLRAASLISCHGEITALLSAFLIRIQRSDSELFIGLVVSPVQGFACIIFRQCMADGVLIILFHSFSYPVPQSPAGNGSAANSQSSADTGAEHGTKCSPCGSAENGDSRFSVLLKTITACAGTTDALQGEQKTHTHPGQRFHDTSFVCIHYQST